MNREDPSPCCGAATEAINDGWRRPFSIYCSECGELVGMQAWKPLDQLFHELCEAYDARRSSRRQNLGDRLRDARRRHPAVVQPGMGPREAAATEDRGSRWYHCQACGRVVTSAAAAAAHELEQHQGVYTCWPADA